MGAARSTAEVATGDGAGVATAVLGGLMSARTVLSLRRTKEAARSDGSAHRTTEGALTSLSGH